MIKNLDNKMEKCKNQLTKTQKRINTQHNSYNKIIEIKNTPEGINSRISEAEKRIGELEDKMLKINSEEKNKVKRMKRAEDSLRDLWDHIKHTNI